MARILLAETNGAVRDFVAGILSDCGHDVSSCATRNEADACLAAAQVDIVVTDLVLRGDDGLGFGVRCFLRGVPTVTLSGGEFRADMAERERPLPLVDKPFRFSDLQSVLDAVARHAGLSAVRRAGRTAA